MNNFKGLLGWDNKIIACCPYSDPPKIEPSGLSSKLSDFLDDSLYLNLRDEIIRILPQHWVDRVVNIITFQAKKYRGSDIAKMCKLNGNQFKSLGKFF